MDDPKNAALIIGPSVIGGTNTTPRALEVLVTSGTVTPVVFDAITVDYPSDTIEIYTYKTGGVSGTVVAAVTVTYTDDTKEFIDTVERA